MERSRTGVRHAMPYAVAILASLVGGFISFLFVVLLFASTPNSTDAQLAEIRNWIIAVAAVTLVAAGGAIWLMVTKRPWIAAGLGVAPALFSIVSFVVLLRTQR